MVRSVGERNEARADRLALLLHRDPRGNTADQLARLARTKLWTTRAVATVPPPGPVALGPAPPSAGEVVLRAGLILRRFAPVSPLLDVAAPRSAAVQLLLVALMAAQCRRPAGAAGHPTQIPLRDPVDETSTSWRYLVALPTVDTGTVKGRGTTSRTTTENRLAQLRTALTRLQSYGRIELTQAGRGRFERFRLLNEAVPRSGEAMRYTRPGGTERVIRVPVEFFLNGWVHALTDSEIAAYLFLLYKQQHNPPDPVNGVAIPREEWGEAFGSARAHIGYRMLARFGLVQIFRQEVRRDDGTIEEFGSDEYLPSEPLRFIVDPAALHHDALTTVLPAVRAATRTRLDEAWIESTGGAITGVAAPTSSSTS